MKRRNRYHLTFHHRKKLFYAISSLIISSVLLFTGTFDIIAVTLIQNPNLSTHKFMKTIMVREYIIKLINAKTSTEIFLLLVKAIAKSVKCCRVSLPLMYSHLYKHYKDSRQPLIQL